MDIGDIVASVLEAPELTADVVGQAFSAVGERLQALAERIDALEAQLRGET